MFVLAEGASAPTAGPWTIVCSPVDKMPLTYNQGHEYKIKAGRGTYILVGGNDREANARLIAAAPAMIDLLSQMADCWAKGVTCNLPPACQFSTSVLDVLAQVEGKAQ